MDEQMNENVDAVADAVDAAATGAEGGLSALPTDISGAQQWLQDNSGMLTSYAVKIVGVIVVLFIAWIIAAWVARIATGALRKMKVDETLTRFVGKTARWAVLLLAILGCLGLFGVDVTSFAVVLGAMGLAIGLAFQGTLSNLAAGVMLLIFRPFKVDDVVSVGGVTGKVIEIELFSTILDTPDNRRMIMPNSAIFGAVIWYTARLDKSAPCGPLRRMD
jgi:small conductance mechanosensitive channel